MGELVIATYRPREGRENELLEIVKEHVPILRSQGLVTDQPALVMRAKNGTLLEVFEWTSTEAVEDAHHDPVVRAMWKRFDAACTFESLTSLEECKVPFPHFEPVDM